MRCQWGSLTGTGVVCCRLAISMKDEENDDDKNGPPCGKSSASSVCYLLLNCLALQAPHTIKKAKLQWSSPEHKGEENDETDDEGHYEEEVDQKKIEGLLDDKKMKSCQTLVIVL